MALMSFLFSLSMYTGIGVHFSGKSYLNGFIICFVLTVEAEGSSRICSVSCNLSLIFSQGLSVSLKLS